MYIPKAYITALAAIDALMRTRHPDLVALDEELAREKEWKKVQQSISRAPAPIRPVKHDMGAGWAMSSHGGPAGEGRYSGRWPFTSEDKKRLSDLEENLQRIDTARCDMVGRLRIAFAESEMPAWLILPQGTIMILSESVWRPDKALDLLAQGDAEIGALGQHPVLILRSDFEQWTGTAASARPSPGDPISGPKLRKGKTGPKTTKTEDAANKMISDYRGRSSDLENEKLISLAEQYNVGISTASEARAKALPQVNGQQRGA